MGRVHSLSGRSGTAPTVQLCVIRKPCAGADQKEETRTSKMQYADLHQRIKLRAYLLWERKGSPRDERRSTGCALRRRWRVSTLAGRRRPPGRPAQARLLRRRCRSDRASTSARRARGPGASVGTDVRYAAAPAALSTFPNRDLRDYSVARRHAESWTQQAGSLRTPADTAAPNLDLERRAAQAMSTYSDTAGVVAGRALWPPRCDGDGTRTINSDPRPEAL